MESESWVTCTYRILSFPQTIQFYFQQSQIQSQIQFKDVNYILTLFREGIYLTRVVNMPYGPHTLTIASKYTRKLRTVTQYLEIGSKHVYLRYNFIVEKEIRSIKVSINIAIV